MQLDAIKFYKKRLVLHTFTRLTRNDVLDDILIEVASRQNAYASIQHRNPCNSKRTYSTFN